MALTSHKQSWIRNTATPGQLITFIKDLLFAQYIKVTYKTCFWFRLLYVTRTNASCFCGSCLGLPVLKISAVYKILQMTFIWGIKSYRLVEVFILVSVYTNWPSSLNSSSYVWYISVYRYNVYLTNESNMTWLFKFGPILFGPNDLRAALFGCQATNSILQQVSRKESLSHYTDCEPASCLPNSLESGAKLRSANLPVLRLWSDAVGDWTRLPPAPWVDALTTRLHG